MKVHALWWGGPGYSEPTIAEDLEVFDSIEAAGRELRTRYLTSWGRIRRPDGSEEWTNCPLVEDESNMHLYFSDPREGSDPWPDRRLTLGPRGGIRSENM